MKVYLVGGAVRDALMGRAVQDRDWVVVGASPQQMLQAGFTQVGRDFPVFLHPRTREEYALARTERKSAPGYRGFVVHAAPDVTLEQDLARRDLSINAIAAEVDPAVQEQTGAALQLRALVDPYGGQADIQARVLRHTTTAFREDPVRLLRLARFAARFPDFRLDPQTAGLLQDMVHSGEVDHLVAERVWAELARGLMEARPSRMLAVLADSGAQARLLPDLARLEPDRLDRAADQGLALESRYALLDGAGNAALQQRLRVPQSCADLARLLAQSRAALASGLHLEAAALVHTLDQCDAWRKPERFAQLLASAACEQPALGGAVVQRWQQALACARAVDAGAVAATARAGGADGMRIAEQLRLARTAAVAHGLAIA